MEQSQTTRGVQKQLILRMFLPNMETLKATARQVSAMPGVKLGLFGQAGEVLVAVTATTASPAAAMQLLESAAERFESALGDSVYGRGKATLANTVADELVQDDNTLAAADEDTGRLLEEEMNTAKQGERVFDFGQMSFRNARISAKIEKAAALGDDAALPPYQLAADRSFAAEKCTKSPFGVAITGTEQGSNMVCAAVTYGKYVYVRCIRPAPDAAKSAALTALDIIRRLTLGMPVPYARPFLASEEIDWNNPIEVKGSGKKSKGGKIGLIVLLVAVAVALVVGGVYIFRTFFANAGADEITTSASLVTGESAPADGGAAAPDAQTVTDSTSFYGTSGGHGEGGDVAAADAAPAPADADGITHPLAG